ncbi:hypothetical protein AAFF_G00189170 [Aldrovandia affinis]|uniref:Uncharacterized protein n=1 Tax=Aldrovandia affinis TaxID=143900 RepID=A0AAD7VXD0_9TELE|nr:hypothetical protein AAFF_G00189170 [Aldrovandia affinis]
MKIRQGRRPLSHPCPISPRRAGQNRRQNIAKRHLAASHHSTTDTYIDFMVRTDLYKDVKAALKASASSSRVLSRQKPDPHFGPSVGRETCSMSWSDAHEGRRTHFMPHIPPPTKM